MKTLKQKPKKTAEQMEASRLKHKASNMPKRARAKELHANFLAKLQNIAIAEKEKQRKAKELETKTDGQES